MPASDKYSILLNPFICYKEIEVLLIQPQLPFSQQSISSELMLESNKLEH
jgi:hypothetical protein